MEKSLTSLRILSGRLFANRCGLATVESALFIPMFIFATLAVFDLGRAGAVRMDIDQALRAGAQVSMINITDESEVMNATLAALGEMSSGTILGDGLCAPDTTCVDATFQCECVLGVATACASICAGTGEPPSAYLTISAGQRHEGLLFPDFDVSSDILVQTR